MLIDLQTGKIIAQKNSDLIFSPASMTKVMTLIVACENLTVDDLDRQLPLSQDVVEYVTTGNYFGTELSLPQKSNGITCIGDTYSIKDLLYGIGVSSAGVFVGNAPMISSIFYCVPRERWEEVKTVFDRAAAEIGKDVPYELKNQADGKIVDHIYKGSSLIDGNEIYYVGDSKYYSDGSEVGENSIYKQFTYAKNIIQFNINLWHNWRPQDKLDSRYKVRYRDDYDEFAQYTAFMDAVLDESNSFEAMDAISAMSVYIQKKWFNG